MPLEAGHASRGSSPGLLATTRRPAAWIRLGAGLAAAGYAVVAAQGLLAVGSPAGPDRLLQLGAAAACAVAFLLSGRAPTLAAWLGLGSVQAELLFALSRDGLDSGSTYVLPLVVVAAGLFLGGRASVALATAWGVATATAVVLGAGAAAGPPSAVVYTRLLVLEIVLGVTAALTWSALRAYGAARATSEAEGRQAQRLEPVGRLAGGIARDFDDLMAAIGGTASALAGHPDTEVRALAGEIEDAQRRGSTLTRQLLAFARREARRPEPVELAEAVRGMRRLLERVLGEQHRLVLRVEGEAPVLADRGELEQVAVTLVADARAATPCGGDVRVTVRTASGEEAAALGSTLPGGRQVLLEVSTDGPGSAPDVTARVFDLRFTAKPGGDGAGLGLATVQGILAQSGGHVALDTAPGRGASIRVFLPLGAAAPAPGPPPVKARTPGEPERILLVEDDVHVRHLAERVLGRAGYRVTVADSGAAALAAFVSAPDTRLLLTDVAMPGMTGLELAARLRAAAPGLRVLYMSGYYDTSLADASLDPARELVEKPFSPEVLLRRVRAALDA